jgi:hypothetical protein
MTIARATGGIEAGVNLERCDDTAQHILGQVVEGVTNLGHYARFRYVKFVDAVAYLASKAVAMASATTWSVTNDVSGGSALANLHPVGMTFQATPPTQNQFGWIQIDGIATFTAGSASIIAGDELRIDTGEDGDCEEATAGTDEAIIGYALATVADNATGLCMLTIRGA